MGGVGAAGGARGAAAGAAALRFLGGMGVDEDVDEDEDVREVGVWMEKSEML